MTIIDRLLRACATGVGCRATINMKALRTIDVCLWPKADIPLSGSLIRFRM